MNVEIEHIVGADNTLSVIENIELERAGKIVRSMDQKTTTLCLFNRGDGYCLMIGGGLGKYIIVLNDNGDGSSNYISNGKKFENVMLQLVVGGQLGDFEGKYIVEEDEMLEVLNLFYCFKEENFKLDHVC